MRESYSYELVDRNGTWAGILPRVESASITGNVNRPIRWDGKLTVAGITGVDWTQRRVRIFYHRDDYPRVQLGLFVAEPDATSHYESDNLVGVEREELSLYDRTKVLADTMVTNAYTVPSGTNVTTAVSAAIGLTGEKGVSITPRAETLRTDLVWDPGTTILRIVNDLLEAGGFFSIHTNTAGQFQVVPYKPPAERPVVRRFAPGSDDPYAPHIGTDLPGIPVNRMTLVARGDGDAPDLIATARDQADFNATGLWRDDFDEGVEATSQGVLQAMAERRLREARRVTWTRNRDVAITSVRDGVQGPPLALNDVVSGYDGGRETVEEISLDLTFGELASVKTRQVGQE